MNALTWTVEVASARTRRTPAPVATLTGGATRSRAGAGPGASRPSNDVGGLTQVAVTERRSWFTSVGGAVSRTTRWLFGAHATSGPATTSWALAAGRWRTTTTGQLAWRTHCWPTEPTDIPRKGPRPRETDDQEIGSIGGVEQRTSGGRGGGDQLHIRLPSLAATECAVDHRFEQRPAGLVELTAVDVDDDSEGCDRQAITDRVDHISRRALRRTASLTAQSSRPP